MVAVSAGHTGVVETLLAHGATPFCVTVEERPETAVMLAQKGGMEDLVQKLVDAGLRWCGVESQVEELRAGGCYDPEELGQMMTQLFC